MPGTKDAGHCYNEQLTEFLVSKVGFSVNDADHASFRMTKPNGHFINLNIHVDDTAAFSSSQKLLDDVFKLVNVRFPMKRRYGIGLFVGISTKRDEAGVHFWQTTLINDTVMMAGLENTKGVSTPCHGTFKGFTPKDITLDVERRKIYDKFPYRQLVGKIAYIARNTRIDIAWITCELQRYGTNFTEAQIDAVLHLIKYLNGTKLMPLTYRSGFKHPVKLFIAVDAGYGTSLINRASHEGMIAFYKGCPIAHSSKRQKVIALSSMESEFMAATEAAKFSRWLLRLLDGFGLKVEKPVPLLEDNQACIYLSKHPSLNGSRSRHMEIRWHWLQEAVKSREVVMVYLPTAGQLADILTKATPKHVHDKLVPSIMGQHTAHNPLVLEALSSMMRDQRKEGKACSTRGQEWRRKHEAELNEHVRNILRPDINVTEFCSAAIKSAPRRSVHQKRRKEQAPRPIVNDDTAWSLLTKLLCLVFTAVLFFGRRLIDRALVACAPTNKMERYHRLARRKRSMQPKRNKARYRSSVGSSNRPKGARRWQPRSRMAR